MHPSPWTKTNKSYILFGTTLQMPPQPAKPPGRPRVILFDIGGVCVSTPSSAYRSAHII